MDSEKDERKKQAMTWVKDLNGDTPRDVGELKKNRVPIFDFQQRVLINFRHIFLQNQNRHSKISF